jgi:hypothetical protein
MVPGLMVDFLVVIFWRGGGAFFAGDFGKNGV